MRGEEEPKPKLGPLFESLPLGLRAMRWLSGRARGLTGLRPGETVEEKGKLEADVVALSPTYSDEELQSLSDRLVGEEELGEPEPDDDLETKLRKVGLNPEEVMPRITRAQRARRMLEPDPKRRRS